ncbi:MAG: leucine-rich repeat domain-containing protein [Clostridia bacterium]|nr:leucine-rich repeat domain-containing protein [Clostridia bacterium]
MNKKLLVLLTVVAVICALLLAVGCKGNDGGSSGGNNTLPSDGPDNNIGSGEDIPQDHSHAFANVWSSDNRYHWHAATCGHDVVADKAKHSYNSDNQCTVCNYYTSAGFVFQLNSDNNSYKVMGVEESYNDTSLVIPASYMGKPVTAIEGKAFEDRSELVSVSIPASITSIGALAFEGCNGLSRVDITDIDSWCKINFRGSHSNPLQYAKKLYLNNVLVTQLTLPKDITFFDNYAFYNCIDLTSITVDADNAVYKSEGNCLIERASNTLIMGCSNSTIPDDVTRIGVSAFEGCIGLTAVSIPRSVTTIDESAFKACVNLKNVELVSGLKIIEMQAFDGCRSLTSVTIPDSVTDVGAMAFAFCNSLTSVTIPIAVESLGQFAFVGCRAVTVYCEAASEPIGWHEFWNNDYPVVWDCNSNDVATDGNIYYIADNGLRFAIKDGEAAVAVQPETLGGSITIPSTITYKDAVCSVTRIVSSAFQNCKDLVSIKIPACIGNVEFRAFFNCSNLSIYCEVASKPNGWNTYWNESDCPVTWGYNFN